MSGAFHVDIVDQLEKLSPTLGTIPSKLVNEAVAEIVQLRKFRDAVRASLRDPVVPFPDPSHFL